MDRIITDYYDMIKELMPIFYVPICIALFSSIPRIIKDIAQGNIEIEERKTKEKEKDNCKDKKIEIDKDLQKYFNYKE